PRRRRSPTLFPYTTLFRSRRRLPHRCAQAADDPARGSRDWRKISGSFQLEVPVEVGDRFRREVAHRHAAQDDGELGGFLEFLDGDRKSTRLNSSHVKISYA